MSLPLVTTKFDYVVAVIVLITLNFRSLSLFFILPPYHSLGCFYYMIIGVPKADSIPEKCLSPYSTSLNPREHKDEYNTVTGLKELISYDLGGFAN